MKRILITAIILLAWAPAWAGSTTVVVGQGKAVGESFTYIYPSGGSASPGSTNAHNNAATNAGGYMTGVDGKHVTRLEVYVSDVSSCTAIKIALYEGGDLVVSGTIASPTTGWNYATITSTEIYTAIQDYRVFFQGNSNFTAGKFGDSGGFYADKAYADAWPAQISSAGDPNFAVRMGYSD